MKIAEGGTRTFLPDVQAEPRHVTALAVVGDHLPPAVHSPPGPARRLAPLHLHARAQIIRLRSSRLFATLLGLLAGCLTPLQRQALRVRADGRHRPRLNRPFVELQGQRRDVVVGVSANLIEHVGVLSSPVVGVVWFGLASAEEGWVQRRPRAPLAGVVALPAHRLRQESGVSCDAQRCSPQSVLGRTCWSTSSTSCQRSANMQKLSKRMRPSPSGSSSVHSCSV